jgi:hypothetical protein
MGSFMERLGNQTRIVGWRRLGTNVLIEFAEELPKDWDPKNALFAPKALAHIHIAVPAPCVGNFSAHIAHSVVETAAAICSFALGRAVSLPPTVFPTRPAQIPDVSARQLDQTVLTLARKHVPLDIFSVVGAPGGLDHFQRLRSSLLTFDAAKRQEHDAVACILFVVVAECLTTLTTPWRDSQLTKRFIEFFDDLMPEELDQIVSHGNFEASLACVAEVALPVPLEEKCWNRYTSSGPATYMRVCSRAIMALPQASRRARTLAEPCSLTSQRVQFFVI